MDPKEILQFMTDESKIETEAESKPDINARRSLKEGKGDVLIRKPRNNGITLKPRRNPLFKTQKKFERFLEMVDRATQTSFGKDDPQ